MAVAWKPERAMKAAAMSASSRPGRGESPVRTRVAIRGGAGAVGRSSSTGVDVTSATGTDWNDGGVAACTGAAVRATGAAGGALGGATAATRRGAGAATGTET